MTPTVRRLVVVTAGAFTLAASIALPAAPAVAGAPCVRWQSCSGDGSWEGARRLAASCRASGGVAYKGADWPERLDVECEGGPRDSGRPVWV